MKLQKKQKKYKLVELNNLCILSLVELYTICQLFYKVIMSNIHLVEYNAKCQPLAKYAFVLTKIFPTLSWRTSDFKSIMWTIWSSLGCFWLEFIYRYINICISISIFRYIINISFRLTIALSAFPIDFSLEALLCRAKLMKIVSIVAVAMAVAVAVDNEGRCCKIFSFNYSSKLISFAKTIKPKHFAC